MTLPITEQSKWQQMMQRQAIANAEHWLSLVDEGDNHYLVLHEYDNLLRALEFTLRTQDTFPLAYSLIIALFANALTYADFDRWLIYLESAIDTSRTVDHQAAEAQLLMHLGNLYLEMGNLDEAKVTFNRADRLFVGLGDTADHAKTLTRIAVIHYAEGEKIEGIRLCQEASELAHHIGNNEVVAHAHLVLSTFHISGQDWEEGLRSADQACDLFDEIDDRTNYTNALLNKIACLNRLGYLDETSDLPNRLLQELSEQGNVHVLGKLRNNLGNSAQASGHTSVAEKHYLEALEIFSQAKMPKDLALTYNNLGYLYLESADYESADEMLAEAITILRRLQDAYYLANTLDNLALLYERQGRRGQAKLTLKEALDQLSLERELPPHAHALRSEIESRLAAL